MSLQPASVKRRRLENNTSILKKPFISPLKAKVPRRASSRQSLNDGSAVPCQPSTLAHRASTVSQVSSAQSTTNTNDVATVDHSKSTPIRKVDLHRSGSLKPKASPAEIAVQRELSRLQMQMRALTDEIDALKQAAALRSSTTDADLEDLSYKWKLASQTAAEELFGTVKERVYRMGGVAAWRESEKRKFERSTGVGEFAEDAPQDDDADCEFDSQGEELPEEEQAWRKKQKVKAREEAKDAAEMLSSEPDEIPAKTTVWQESSAEDDVFTMDMMLRSLNIELDVIGYDRQDQRWVS